MGAWIEIGSRRLLLALNSVAPYMGAWIEIFNSILNIINIRVAPYMGAWIEIATAALSTGTEICRSLHGSVD